MTDLAPIRAAEARPAADLQASLRVLTCGSVDDGKSTLIGRLLWDAADLADDQRAAVAQSKPRAGGHPDFSLLLDGLIAEREQGITIDIAWRTFDTASRRFVLIDSPGHEQYTRNMASGASHADAAIMLVDARHGIKRQTRRHAAILDLVGIRRVVLAVNKMDLVDWSEARFREIAAEFTELTQRFGFHDAVANPVAARSGDNVATVADAMPWYTGPTLLQHLERLPGRGSSTDGPFRMPVQLVLRDGGDFRALAGTISSGRIRVGEQVVDGLSGNQARVARILLAGRPLEVASEGQAVVVQLDRDLDISRGALLASARTAPVAARRLEARLVWLAESPLDADTGHLVQTATDLVPVSGIEIKARLDLETLAQHPASTCTVNDIVVADIALGRETAVDLFARNRETGSFLLVDAVTGTTVAGGVITVADAAEGKAAVRSRPFRLTRELLANGLCRGLGASFSDRVEFSRRAREAERLLRLAGVEVEAEDA